MERIYLYVWTGASAALTLTAILVRTIRGQRLPPSENFFKASVTLGGAIMMLRVFLKVFNSDVIQAELESDGIIAICASSLWIAFLGLKESVVMLCFDTKKPRR